MEFTVLEELRRSCEARIQQLGLVLPVPFTLQAFSQALGRCLQRDIVLKPVDTRTGPCGLWVATDSCDYFFYEQRTSPLHQAVIVGHEGGHAAFEHESADVDAVELAGLLGLDVGLIRLVLGRTTYSKPEERLAEVFGTLVGEHAGRSCYDLAAAGAADPGLDRLEQAFG